MNANVIIMTNKTFDIIKIRQVLWMNIQNKISSLISLQVSLLL